MITTMNLIKQFFYFTKSKLITFVILSLAILYLMGQQNMVLGNYTLLILLIILLTLYLILSILWFSFKSKKHFLIGLIAFALLLLIQWISENYSNQKRITANEECLTETNSQSFNGEVMNCMSKKGYKKYR